MFGQTSLKSSEIDKLKSISQNIRNSFKQYEVIFSEGIGKCFIQLNSNGRPVNRFDFYANQSGNLGSVAVYGSELKNLKDTIQQSKIFFGLKVIDCVIDIGGFEPFLDITLESEFDFEDYDY